MSQWVDVTSLLLGFLPLVVGFVGGAFVGPYLRKKGENLATQQDIGNLTKIVEDIRHQNKLAIEQGTHRHQLRLAALERRLVAHQQAYTRWWQLRFLINRDEDKLFNFADECQEWWTQNCLFLEAEAREAFYDAIDQAFIHARLVTYGSVSEEVKKRSWEVISRAGPLLVKAVELPVINADEETPSSRPRDKSV